MLGKLPIFSALFLFCMFPNPSSPCELLPHVQGVPSSSRNTECAHPAVIEFMDGSSNFVKGWWLDATPNPNCPLELSPHAQTWFSSSRNNECLSKEAAMEVIFGRPGITLRCALFSKFALRPSVSNSLYAPQLYTF